MRTERINMRVFIEGVLVPKVSSATVHTFANEEARASFVMPSIPGFTTEELKRARVHIFWSNIEIRNEREDDDWPVLFEGEITADNYDKSVTSRNQMWYCSGYHTYWEQVLLYYYELGQGPYSKAVWSQNVTVALGNNLFSFDGAVPGANLRQRMAGKVLDEKEPYPSFVKRIFSECLDTNHFFRQSDNRLKLTSRFTAVEDPNLDVLVGRSLLSEAISNDQVTMSGESSMMRTLKAVLDVFKYQIVHNAQPVLLQQEERKLKTGLEKENDSTTILENLRTYLTKANVEDGLRDKTVSFFEESLLDKEIVNLADKIIKELKLTEDTAARESLVQKMKDTRDLLRLINDPERKVDAQGLQKDDGDLLTQFLLLPDMRFALPPTCNIIFPQDQTQLSMHRNLLQEPTRAIGLPQQIAGLPFGLYLAPPELDQAVIPTVTIEPVTKNGFYPPITASHRISSGFGPRQIKQREKKNGKVVWVPHPTASKFHKGVDIARPNIHTDFLGTSVYAFDEGTVTLSGWQDRHNEGRGYGLRVYLNHGSGLQTRYGHLKERTVYEGQKVSRGQRIGEVGSTGVSTGAHLHFEIRVNGRPVDPEPHIATATTEDLSTTTQEPQSLTKDEESITKIANRTSKQFLDFEYLTPEEQKTGIVPFFDQSVIRGYAFMQFLGKPEQVRRHYLNMLNSEFLWRRYETRNMPALNLPFNPYPVAGFPALIIDRVRSIIGLISNITHTISVGGGQGVAASTVQVEAPRFWDEGDPYYWVNGKRDMETVSDGSEFDGRELPSPINANFPSYYLDKLVPVNSSTDGDRWWNTDEPIVPPTSKQKTRPVDQLYSALLGSNVRGIPYQYSRRKSVARGTNVVFNKAIDGTDADNLNVDYRETGGKNYRNTIVGYYYHLVNTNSELAEAYVRTITRRYGATERVIMTTVLGTQATKANTFYVGNAFDKDYQTLVNKMNTILAQNVAFRG